MSKHCEVIHASLSALGLLVMTFCFLVLAFSL
jgi:hypothetical protein